MRVSSQISTGLLVILVQPRVFIVEFEGSTVMKHICYFYTRNDVTQANSDVYHCLQHSSTEIKQMYSPNVAIDELALTLRSREVHGSDLSSKSKHPDRGSSWQLSIPRAKCQDNALKQATTTSIDILS
jgi:hypothetical protein